MKQAKQILYTAAFLIGGLSMSAQSSNVTNAIFSYKAAVEKYQAEDFAGMAKELSEAIAEIEPATQHEKTMAKEKTWRNRAMIYELVSRNMDKPEVAALTSDPIGLAADSYQKAMELDKKGAYEVENKRGLLVAQNLAMQTGIAKFNEKDFGTAFGLFEKADQLGAAIGLTDSMAVYNAALAAERGEDYDNAIKYYRKSLEAGFDDAGIYKFIAEAHKAKGDSTMAEEVIFEGRKAYPADKGLLIDEVNIYLGKGQLDKALDNLKLTLAQDPENPELQYSVGAVYDNLGNTEEARQAYLKAIELNDGYFNANYNLGASYYNEGVEMINTANAIPPSKTKEYNAAKAKADAMLKSALPYLEKAHELEPTDQSTMASLAEVYVRTNQLEKRKAIMAKMGQ